VRGSDRPRAGCAGSSLHAGVVVPNYDRQALERCSSSDGYRATVRLTPSWLVWCFGARETVVELEYEGSGSYRRRIRCARGEDAR